MIGGIPKQSTRKFLSDSEEVSEEDPKITEENIAQYNALLWPLKEVESALIIKFCQREFSLLLLSIFFYILFIVLGEPNFLSIADVDTPSGFSSVLDLSHIEESSSSSAPAESSTSDGSRGAFGGDLLSSTMRDDASSSQVPNLDISRIQEILFCSKCGDIFQT